MDPELQDWRGSIESDSSSLLAQDDRPSPLEGLESDVIYGPEGASSFTMDQAALPIGHSAEMARDILDSGVGQQASAGDASSSSGGGEELEPGGTLIVAPPSVVKLVWASELASKVLLATQGLPLPLPPALPALSPHPPLNAVRT